MHILDFEKLLAPISQENPTGINLREDISSNSLYYKIKDARSAARTAERNKLQEAQGTTAKENWEVVYELGLNITISHSKDLEIVTWLLESLLRKFGFTGLWQGFRLIKELVLIFWDELYPCLDEDGVEARIATFAGLNGREIDGALIVPIACVLITAGKSVGPFNFWQYQQARDIDLITDRNNKEQRLAAGAVSIHEFNKAVSETSKEFFNELLNDLQLCLDEFNELVIVLDAKCGEESPPSSHIKNKITDCLDCVKIISENALTKDKLKIINEVNQENLIIAENTSLDRETALHTLLKIAQFFHRIEPHSPIPYLLERAVKWGRMPLNDLLNELIIDESARDKVRELTGI